MSQYYDRGDETLWNPSNGASRLFLRQVAVFEEELDLPSGIGPMVSDECQVDPAALGVFAHALLARHRQTPHAVVRALTEGFLITVLALAERAGVELHGAASLSAAPASEFRDLQISANGSAADNEDSQAWEEELRGRARELGRFLAR
ncbi:MULTISPECIES: DUF6086 family protein [unclassified Kitasatospora]|uniref:DUF6086 family protein n=1 Tax=unclassified Kitasatospora TaxID=2633591 RepID=UPI003807EFA6